MSASANIVIGVKVQAKMLIRWQMMEVCGESGFMANCELRQHKNKDARYCPKCGLARSQMQVERTYSPVIRAYRQHHAGDVDDESDESNFYAFELPYPNGIQIEVFMREEYENIHDNTLMVVGHKIGEADSRDTIFSIGMTDDLSPYVVRTIRDALAELGLYNQGSGNAFGIHIVLYDYY